MLCFTKNPPTKRCIADRRMDKLSYQVSGSEPGDQTEFEHRRKGWKVK